MTICSPIRFDESLGRNFNTERTVIVGRGRLGAAFAHLWNNARVICRDRLDITSREAVLREINNLRADLVVNCAAKTDMQFCQSSPDAAWQVNVRGVRNLAEAARSTGATLVHFSSDYARDPVNEYAWTKLASESLGDLTIRAKIYDASHWAWNALRKQEAIKMSLSEYSNPITTTAVVAITAELVRRGARGRAQIGTAERLNFFEIGRVWARVLDAPLQLVQPISEVYSPIPRLNEMFLLPSEVVTSVLGNISLAEDASQHEVLYRGYGA